MKLFYQHWQVPDHERVVHAASHVLLARWAAGNTPVDTVIIQAAEEWNVNLLPYYSARRPIVRSGGNFFLFEPQGAFTPLNYHAFRALTPEGLQRLLNKGVPIFALNAEPFSEGSALAEVPVVWQPITVRMEGQELTVYRGQPRS